MTNSSPETVSTPKMSPLRRVYATVGFHRAMPWPLAVRSVQLRAARLWNVPAHREHALRSMEFVVGASSRAGEVETLARRWMFETLKRDELTWRPWQTTRFDVERLGVLDGAVRSGSGVILSFFHHGQHGGIFGSLARHGFRSHVAVLESLLEPGHDYKGLRQRQHVETAKLGSTVFAAKGSMDHMRGLLRDGEIVGLASDLAGSLPMTMLGRRVSAGSGAARLAVELGVPIVPVTSHPRGTFQHIRIGDPIDPREHDGPESVQQAIADAHAPAILEWPEGLMEPLERWRAVEETDVERFGVAPVLT